MRVVIDAMGGDHGPGPVVEGALPARSRCPADLVLVGNETVVREALGPRPGGTIPGVIDAPQSVTMEESGPLAICRKREASVNVYRAGVLQGYQGSSARAPLLGVKRPVVVAHGRSSAPAISSAIALACQIAADGLCRKMTEELEQDSSLVDFKYYNALLILDGFKKKWGFVPK